MRFCFNLPKMVAKAITTATRRLKGSKIMNVFLSNGFSIDFSYKVQVYTVQIAHIGEKQLNFFDVNFSVQWERVHVVPNISNLRFEFIAETYNKT